MPKHQRLIAALAALALIGGVIALCDYDGPIPRLAPTVSPLPLPSPTGPALDRDTAAQRYLEIVGPRNDALDELDWVLGTRPGLAEAQEAVKQFLAAVDTEIVSLAGTQWPADVRPAVDRLVAKLMSSRQLWMNAAYSRTVSAFYHALDEAYAHDQCAEADAVRAALGLPPACG